MKNSSMKPGKWCLNKWITSVKTKKKISKPNGNSRGEKYNNWKKFFIGEIW